MSRRFLCAVDLTHDADARAILSEAWRMAVLQGAALSVVTVLPDYGSSWVGSFFKDGALREAAEAAVKALRALVETALPAGSEAQCVVEIGTAYEKVLDAAERVSAELIIVGAHKPDLAETIIGPNAARIVRNAPVSVLVVRL